jgi:hypothetical protein
MTDESPALTPAELRLYKEMLAANEALEIARQEWAQHYYGDASKGPSGIAEQYKDARQAAMLYAAKGEEEVSYETAVKAETFLHAVAQTKTALGTLKAEVAYRRPEVLAQLNRRLKELGGEEEEEGA